MYSLKSRTSSSESGEMPSPSTTAENLGKRPPERRLAVFRPLVVVVEPHDGVGPGPRGQVVVRRQRRAFPGLVLLELLDVFLQSFLIRVAPVSSLALLVLALLGAFLAALVSIDFLEQPVELIVATFLERAVFLPQQRQRCS